MLAALHSSVDRGEHEKHLFLPLYGKTENPLMTVRAPRSISHNKRKSNYALCSVLSNSL